MRHHKARPWATWRLTVQCLQIPSSAVAEAAATFLPRAQEKHKNQCLRHWNQTQGRWTSPESRTSVLWTSTRRHIVSGRVSYERQHWWSFSRTVILWYEILVNPSLYSLSILLTMLVVNFQHLSQPSQVDSCSSTLGVPSRKLGTLVKTIRGHPGHLLLAHLTPKIRMAQHSQAKEFL